MPELESSGDMKDYVSRVLLANVRWGERLNQTFPDYFPDPKNNQAPKILWIGCSDSRIQDSDATVTLPGNVFVHRNIANQFHLHDDNALSVLTYALKVLGARHIVVVGHEHCGGVLTALREASCPPRSDQVERRHTLYDSLYELVHRNKVEDAHDKDSKDPMDAITRWLTPLVERVKKLKPELPSDEEAALKIVTEENVKLQIEFICQLDGWVRRHVENRPVWVHGLVYDFSTGFLRDLKVTRELGGATA